MRTSFFASFLSVDRARSKSKYSVPTPKIDIQGIIKKRADMYYDPSLSNSVDDLLESGYTIVLNRKNQKKSLKAEEEELREHISQIERDILPELNKYLVLKDELGNVQTQQVVFVEQAEKVTSEIERVHAMIEARKAEIENSRKAYVDHIDEIKERIGDMKNEIIKNREIHGVEIVELKAEIKEQKQENVSVKEELKKLKAEYEKLKTSQVDKKRKIENKSRMFMGILKH